MCKRSIMRQTYGVFNSIKLAVYATQHNFKEQAWRKKATVGKRSGANAGSREVLK